MIFFARARPFLAACLLTAAATAASAQQAKPAPAPAAPVPAAPAVAAPAPAPAAEPPATPAQLAAAREVMLASGMSGAFAQVVPGIMEQLAVTIVRTRPELQKDLKEVLLGNVAGMSKQVEEDLVDASSKALARHMSEKELADAAAFFDSPAGKKYVQTQPILLDEIAPVMQTLRQKLSVDITTRVRAEMKKRGHDM